MDSQWVCVPGDFLRATAILPEYFLHFNAIPRADEDDSTSRLCCGFLARASNAEWMVGVVDDRIPDPCASAMYTRYMAKSRGAMLAIWRCTGRVWRRIWATWLGLSVGRRRKIT